MCPLDQAISWLHDYRAEHPEADKQEIQDAFAAQFKAKLQGKLFVCSDYAVRFCHASGESFSNTVLALSQLKKVDHIRTVICVIRPDRLDFMLANATFLAKISHSSSKLRIDNVKGSFNGTDIVKGYGGVPNQPDHFEELFAMHSAYTWEENLERLVTATNAIAGSGRRFDPTDAQRATVLEAPSRAASALRLSGFAELARDLEQLAQSRVAEILDLARIENVNLRGNSIEQLFADSAAHDLCDMTCDVGAGQVVGVDVKTKLAGRPSAPKAYNIDKMLAFHAEPGSVLAFLFVRVDLAEGAVRTKIVPVLDESLIDATRIQHHWAGRNSRGVTQLSGLDRVLDAAYEPLISIGRAREFLLALLDIKPATA
jgi:hypothetical protein